MGKKQPSTPYLGECGLLVGVEWSKVWVHGARHGGERVAVYICCLAHYGVRGVRGTLTDCTVTNCGDSGINAKCGDIHIYGAKTQVTGNVLEGICCCPGNDHGSNGLNSKSRSSKIILHAPLTKQFVSHHNYMGMNWSKQHIDTVDA